MGPAVGSSAEGKPEPQGGGATPSLWRRGNSVERACRIPPGTGGCALGRPRFPEHRVNRSRNSFLVLLFWLLRDAVGPFEEGLAGVPTPGSDAAGKTDSAWQTQGRMGKALRWGVFWAVSVALYRALARLLRAAMPIRPEARSSMAVGSGTAGKGGPPPSSP